MDASLQIIGTILTGIVVPMVGLLIRMVIKKDKENNEKNIERDTLLRNTSERIGILEQTSLTKDDVIEEIDRCIEPLAIKVENNIKITEDVQDSLKDIASGLKEVSTKLSRQEGYMEAVEKGHLSLASTNNK